MDGPSVAVFTCPLSFAADVYTNATTGPFAVIPFVHDVECHFSVKSSIVDISSDSLRILNEELAPQLLANATDTFNDQNSDGLAFPAVPLKSPAGQMLLSFKDGSVTLADNVMNLLVDYDLEVLPEEVRHAPLESMRQQVFAEFGHMLAHGIHRAFETKSEEVMI